MEISNLRALPSPFGPSDLSRPKAKQTLGKLNLPTEFKLHPQTEFNLHPPTEFKLDKPTEFKLDKTSEFKIKSQQIDSNETNSLSESKSKPEGEDLRKAFQDFVGQTLFSQMISSMRSTQDGAAYFDGGRAEKIFQGQFDQILSEELSEASASKISDPMFKLFQLRRQ